MFDYKQTHIIPILHFFSQRARKATKKRGGGKK